MPESRRLLEQLASLAATDGPISFYDALGVVRRARTAGALPDEVLSALMTLHDAANLTDGAREILREFLASCAHRVAEERSRTSRPLTLADHLQTVRAVVGDALELALEERAGQGFRWRVAACPSGVSVDRIGSRATDQPGVAAACFRVRLGRPGHLAVTLEEEPPPSAAPPSAKPPQSRRFSLDLLISRP